MSVALSRPVSLARGAVLAAGAARPWEADSLGGVNRVSSYRDVRDHEDQRHETWEDDDGPGSVAKAPSLLTVRPKCWSVVTVRTLECANRVSALQTAPAGP